MNNHASTDETFAPQDIMDVVRLLPDVLFRCYKKDDGKIYWSLNEGGLAEQFGLTTKEIQGKSLEDLFAGGASAELIEHFEAAFRGEVTIFTNEIEGRHFRHFPQPIMDENGNVTEVVGFIAEVTELIQTEKALEAANSELEAFAHTASHDMKGPLAVMASDAYNLRHAGSLNDKQVEAAERIANSVKRLSSMVDALLQMSRAGRMELSRSEVDVTKLAIETATALDERYPTLPTNWSIQENIQVNADPDLAGVVLQNLMENAHKFCRDSPKPQIQVNSIDNEGFEVVDNGIGFDPKQGAAIFRSFTRLNKDYDGSGIGLSTVRRIMDRHGGHCEAIGAPGKGATFRVMFNTEPA